MIVGFDHHVVVRDQHLVAAGTEAALLAARKGKDTVEMEDFDESKDKVLMGVERRSMIIKDSEKRTSASEEKIRAFLDFEKEKQKEL